MSTVVRSGGILPQPTRRAIAGARPIGLLNAPPMQFNVAIRLHEYMVARHWTGGRLIGPDPGVRFNYRIGRFIKSHLPRVDWRDDYYYLQGQGYWTLSNWRLFHLLGEKKFRDFATTASASMLEAQRSDGAWEYPNPEWRGRVATVEGTWASIGLLETFRRTRQAPFLKAVIRWHRFLVERIRFQSVADTLAANYFADSTGDVRVPANCSIVLRFLAELVNVTGQQEYAEQTGGLLRFLQSVQTPSGEFPYAVSGTARLSRDHFQCYQYNAFLCLDLIRYYELTRDRQALTLVQRVLSFLSGGLAADGHAFYACGKAHRAVTYHAAAVAAALRAGARLGFPADDLADRAFAYVLAQQRPDGGFPYSKGDYGVLSDRRSYPRYLAMILFHLLTPGVFAELPPSEPTRGISN